MGRAALTRCSAWANTLVGIRGDVCSTSTASALRQSIGDVVIEGAGGGIDTVIATSSNIMPSEVEALLDCGSGGRAGGSENGRAPFPERGGASPISFHWNLLEYLPTSCSSPAKSREFAGPKLCTVFRRQSCDSHCVIAHRLPTLRRGVLYRVRIDRREVRVIVRGLKPAEGGTFEPADVIDNATS
jgi:hypothetical protein